MIEKYRHRQYGWLMFLVFLIAGVLIAVVAVRMMTEGRIVSAIIMIGITLFGVLMFYGLTIEVSAEKLRFWFGIGIVRKSIELGEIKSVKVIKNPWYYFWGIKSISGGWFYAIAPGHAVEIIQKDGKIIQLGSDQAETLKQAIETGRKLCV